MLVTRALHPLFGVEILGVDVKRVDDATFKEIAAAFEEHSVLLFRSQALTDAEQIAFSQRFGPLEATIRTIVSQGHVPPEISNLSNVDPEDRLIPRGDRRNIFNAGNQMWHTDSSFKRVPALASLLSGREVPPEGGETEFASMRVAYEGLPGEQKRFLEGKVAIHSFTYSRGLVSDGLFESDHAAQVPPVRQALVRTNPVNGRRAFYIASHACEIVGMPTAEGRALIRELIAAATEPGRVYTHRWRVGDSRPSPGAAARASAMAGENGHVVGLGPVRQAHRRSGPDDRQALQCGDHVPVERGAAGNDQSSDKTRVRLVVPQRRPGHVAGRAAGLPHDEIDRRDVPLPGLEGRAHGSAIQHRRWASRAGSSAPSSVRMASSGKASRMVARIAASAARSAEVTGLPSGLIGTRAHGSAHWGAPGAPQPITPGAPRR